MLEIKYRETLGYCVELSGIRLTDYTPFKSLAQVWLCNIYARSVIRDVQWYEQLKPYRNEERRMNDWLGTMARKYRMTRIDKFSYYDKRKAVAMAMQEARG